MKKKYLYVLVPLFVLGVFYFQTKKTGLQGNFYRTFTPNSIFTIKESIPLGGLVDGVCLDHGNLWINRRFYIEKYNKNTPKKMLINGQSKIGNRNPIVNFYVENDSLYYFQANTYTVNFIDLAKDTLQQRLKFDFPFSYFIKSKGNSFIFQENVLGKAASQIHYRDIENETDKVDKTVFSREPGSSMKYSGCFLSSADKNNLLFIPYYDDDIVHLDSTGTLIKKLKTIDFQNAKLEIIREGNVFYLNPKSNMIRLAACVYKDYLFISSNIRDQKQSKKDFDDNLVIDVYKISKGKYLHSFFVPRPATAKPNYLTITKDKILYVLYGNNVISYNIVNELNNDN